MSTTTVRANARVLSKATPHPDAEILARNDQIIERVNRRYNKPGLYEMGLESLAKAADTPIPDPIFNSIEAHRTAWARIAEAHENLEGLSSKDAFTLEIKARGREADDAKKGLLKTPPATPRGAQAIIKYLIDWDKDCEPNTSYEYLSTLLVSPIFALAEDAERVLAQVEEEGA
jgi:hypothetical protein